MISNKNRIKRADFNKIAKKSKKIESEMFSIRVHFPIEAKEPRFSVVISSKVVKGAVIRNQIKRRIYTILAEKYLKNSPNKLFFSIIYVRKPALGANYQVLKQELIKNIDRVIIDK